MNLVDQVKVGAVYRFGDNVTTDDIIAGKYKHRTIDLDELASHVMENVRPGFADVIQHGDFVVAGTNFGCGSSREQAPAILRHLGVTAVVAASFARIFFRNAINIGLLVLTADTSDISEGDELAFDIQGQRLMVAARAIDVEVGALAPEVQEIVSAGGLLAYVKAHGGL